MNGKLHDLWKQLDLKKQQLQEKVEENALLKKRVEQEYAEKSTALERFPPEIDQVKTIVMKMIYSHKQLQLENMLEAVQKMSLTNTLPKDGLSFYITTYKTRQHSTPNCACLEGFSIIWATIDLSRRHEISSSEIRRS